MKKFIYSLLVLATAAFTFSSCEDVPAPYSTPAQPDDSSSASGVSTGTGSEDDPFNSVAANAFCATLDQGDQSNNDVYIKGKVQSVKEQFSAKYGYATFYIADDANSKTFYVFQVLYLGNKKWTEGDKQIKEGDEVVICGKVTNYSGTYETVKSQAYIYSLNGETAGSGSGEATGEAKGTGTEADPFNSVAAQKYAAALEADKTTDEAFYIKGKIKSFYNNGEFNAKYGNASFYIADDEKSDSFLIFQTYYFGGEKWKDGDQQLKVGDEVVVCAKLVNYKGNTPETSKGGKLISINGKTSSSETTPDTQTTGNEITVSNIISGKTSSEDLPENAYGSQATATESTWYTWKTNGISYSGAKICQAKSSDIYAGCIQMQGNKDTAKQGFLFNTTAFSSNIKSITMVVKGSSDTPTTFGVFAGTAAHPTTTEIKAASTETSKGDTAYTFTITYDFSSANSNYFTIWNNAAGALYIEKITITLK